MLATFPHLTESEFTEACTLLSQRFQRHRHEQRDWTSVSVVHQRSTQYLRITRPLKHKLRSDHDDDSRNDDEDNGGDSDEDLLELSEHDTVRPQSCSPQDQKSITNHPPRNSSSPPHH